MVVQQVPRLQLDCLVVLLYRQLIVLQVIVGGPQIPIIAGVGRVERNGSLQQQHLLVMLAQFAHGLALQVVELGFVDVVLQASIA